MIDTDNRCQPRIAEAFLTPDQIEIVALKAEVSARLARCTEKQQAFFHKVYSMGLDSMDRMQLRNAAELCKRTIRKNEGRPPIRENDMSKKMSAAQIRRLETILAEVEILEAGAPSNIAERLRAAKNELIRALQDSTP